MAAQVVATGVGYADVTNLVRSFAASGQNVHQAATQVVDEATGLTADYAKQYAPVRSGKLRGLITHQVDGLTGTVTAVAPYAIFVELGTGTRGEFPSGVIVIRPRAASYLSWVGPDGRRRYAKVVRSPGMAARPFLRPGLAAAINQLETSLGVAATMSVLTGPGGHG